MKDKKTVEPQYSVCVDTKDRIGFSRFGLMSNFVWDDDPKRLTFLLSRYKFVSKMLSGLEHVLEVGCADAFGSRLVKQEVKNLTVVDFDPIFIEDAKETLNSRWQYDCLVQDILSGPVESLKSASKKFNGAYALDVLEHISPDKEDIFVGNICKSLCDTGVLLLGLPSLNSQVYASPASKAGHINCKNAVELKFLLHKFFNNVFIFSMNDEVVHTGYAPMAHYLFALCCSKKNLE